MNDEEIEIGIIAGTDRQLIQDFAEWLNEAEMLLEPFKYTVGLMYLCPPYLAGLREHNNMGFELAKRIKNVVHKDVKVYYSCIDLRDLLEQVKNKNR